MSRHDEIFRGAAITGADPEDLPEHPAGAWGDYDEDYPPQEDVSASTIEETADFYVPQDIEIKKR